MSCGAQKSCSFKGICAPASTNTEWLRAARGCLDKVGK
jgi:hypothetical protein